MKKINLYLYWYGDENIKKEIQKKFNEISKKIENINVVFGPTNDEHIFLINEFPFYRNAINNKRYSFAADLYRIWKLSNEECIYMDATVEININKFIELLNKICNYETMLIKENGHLIWNGIMYSKNATLYKRILKFYINHYKIASSLTGPLIYSIFSYKEYGCRLNNNNVLYLDSRDIDPYSTTSIFNYNGLGSWGKNKIVDFNNREKTGAHNYFHNNALKFEKGFSKWWIVVRWFIKYYLIYLLPIVIFK